MKFIEKFRKFMYGRYGADELYKFLLYVYILLCVINLFAKSEIVFLLEVLVLTIMFYRIFSKKIYARSKENQKFLELKKRVIKPLNNIKRNIEDKEHIYKKCYKCKTTLKLPLPRKRGIKHAKCPKCKKSITFFTFRQEKIEIIKGGKKFKV